LFTKVRIRGALSQGAIRRVEPAAGGALLPTRTRRNAVPVVAARPAATDPLRMSSKSDGTRPRYATLGELAEARPHGKAPLPKRPGGVRPSPIDPPSPRATAGVVSGSRSFVSPRPWRTPRRYHPDPHAASPTAREVTAQPGPASELEPEPEPELSVSQYSQRNMLAPDEIALVDTLRAEVSDILEDEKAFARLRDDTTLHRFVCARQGDIPAAAEMLRTRQRFHHEFGLDEVWAGWRPPQGMPMSPRAEFGSKIFYAGLSGWTKEGGPLLVERLGRADLAGISREGAIVEDLALEAYVVYLETILRMNVRATREEQK
jgi:hypothetical protein